MISIFSGLSAIDSFFSKMLLVMVFYHSNRTLTMTDIDLMRTKISYEEGNLGKNSSYIRTAYKDRAEGGEMHTQGTEVQGWLT